MTNLTNNQKEVINQVEEVKVNVMDLIELKKKLAKARKDLTSLENKNMNPAVIEAQKKIVEEISLGSYRGTKENRGGARSRSCQSSRNEGKRDKG